MSKPTISTGPASAYAGTGEIIREIHGNGVGCLISVRNSEQGIIVELYRVDHGVRVVVAPSSTPESDETRLMRAIFD